MDDEEFVGRVSAWLRETGRTQAWLARTVGTSPQYLSLVLTKQRTLSPALQDKIRKATGNHPLATLQFAGRTIKVPQCVAKKTVSESTCAFERAQSWKDSWIREHGQAVLARAADEAFERALELSR